MIWSFHCFIFENHDGFAYFVEAKIGRRCEIWAIGYEIERPRNLNEQRKKPSVNGSIQKERAKSDS